MSTHCEEDFPSMLSAPAPDSDSTPSTWSAIARVCRSESADARTRKSATEVSFATWRMRTSVAFLSSMALAMARAVAFDVRAIGVLLVDMMLKYIGFHRRRQQGCRGTPLCDPCTDIRG